MDFSLYGISLEMVVKWMFIGIACTWTVQDIQYRFTRSRFPITSAFFLAATISFVLLLLLLLGFIVTIVSILSFGMGTLIYLSVVSLRNFFFFLLYGKPRKDVRFY